MIYWKLKINIDLIIYITIQKKKKKKKNKKKKKKKKKKKDDEVCQTVQCDLFKDIQGVLRPSDDSNYSEYSKIIYDTVRKVLMKKSTVEDGIRVIVDFTQSIYQYG